MIPMIKCLKGLVFCESTSITSIQTGDITRTTLYEIRSKRLQHYKGKYTQESEGNDSLNENEPRHDKTNKVTVRPAQSDQSLCCAING